MTNYISRKICLIGDSSVGKTSLIRRFTDRQFSDKYLSTVGIKISRKVIDFEGMKDQDSLSLKLLIWDLEGSDKFKKITSSYLQGASGAFVVADITRPDTIEHISEHINLFLSINPKGSIIVAFNKSDLINNEELEDLLFYHRLNKQPQVLSISPTSAKTGLYVDNIFHQLTKNILRSGVSAVECGV